MVTHRARRWSRLVRQFAVLLPALFSCVEGTGPQAIGQLRIRPVFSPGEEPGTIGVALQDIRIVLRRASGAVVVDTTLPWVDDGSTSWLVELTATPEALAVEAALAHGTTALYAGSGTVDLPPGIGPSSTSLDVPVSYLGAGAGFTIDVDPDSVGVAASGDTHVFTAVARDAGGTALDGFTFTWSSSRPDIATVNSATGLATAIGTGRAVITASSGGVTGTAVMTVGATPGGSPASLVVTPAVTTLTAPGATRQFSAVVLDAQDQEIPGIPISWSSSNPAAATITAGGLATAVAAGATTITATGAGLTGTALLAIEFGAGGVPVAIIVSPDLATLGFLGATQAFTATALDVFGQVVPGIAFTWSSTAPEVATVDAGGVATALRPGSASIVASSGDVAGFAGLQVDGSVANFPSLIVVTPANAATSPGGLVQFSAVALNAQGQVIPDVLFTWTSSNTAVATVNASGVALGGSEGTTNISASLGSLAGSASLVVSGGTTGGGPATVVVSPNPASLHGVGATQQMTAVALDGNGAIVPGAVFSWSSTQPGVASIDASGVVTALSAGSTFISATTGNVSGGAVVSVTTDGTPVPVAQVVVTPENATLVGNGTTQAFSAVAYDASGTAIQDVTFTWVSVNPIVATVSASGLATAQSVGATWIQAMAGGVTGTATLSVTPEPGLMPVSVLVIPATATLDSIGARRLFTALALDKHGQVVPGHVFTWSTSDPSVATVTATGGLGLATAVGAGSATLTAVTGALSGTALLKVVPRVATIDVVPATDSIGVGDSLSFAAVARDASGQVIPGIVFAWTTADPAIATISALGRATGVGAGATEVRASSGGVFGTAMLTVLEVGSITITPATPELRVGQTRTLSVTVRDKSGSVVDVPVHWASSDTTIAVVDPVTGLILGVAPGKVSISATAGGVTSQVTLDAPPTSLPR